MTRKLKILVHQAVRWDHGLDSYSRGSGRWCMNIAKMLSLTGEYEVFAAADGPPVWGHGDRYNCTLINGADIRKYEPYDIHIGQRWEGVWHPGVKPFCKSKFYIHSHWRLEQQLQKPLPAGHLLVFPYIFQESRFKNDNNPNSDRSFFLPTPFCSSFPGPNLDKKGIFFPARESKCDNSILGTYTRYVLTRIGKYIEEDPERGMLCTLSGDIRKYCPQFVDFSHPKSEFYVRLSHRQVLDLLKRCRVNFPVMGPSCTLDAVSQGVLTLPWDRAGFFKGAAEKHNLIVRKEAPPEEVWASMDKLMYDDGFYRDYYEDLKYELRAHVYSESHRYFKEILKAVGL